MTNVLEKSLRNPMSLFSLESPVILIDTDDLQLAAEVADFLKIVHGSALKLRLAKMGGFWLTPNRATINEPSLKVASWLYGVPVTLPAYY